MQGVQEFEFLGRQVLDIDKRGLYFEREKRMII